MNILAVIHWFAMFCLGPFIIVKILSRDRKLYLVECIYALFVGLVLGIAFTVFLDFIWALPISGITHNSIVSVAPDVITTIFLFFYLFKIKRYTMKKTFILSFTSMLIVEIAYFTHPLSLIFIPLDITFSATPDALFAQGVTLLLFFAVAVLLSYLLVRFSSNFRNSINQNNLIQTGLLCVVIFLNISVSVNMIFGSTIWFNLIASELGTQLLMINVFFIVVYGVIVIFSLRLFSRSLQTRYELQRQQYQQEALQHYTSELEQQQNAMQKFKHDYQNILFSLEGFLNDEDLSGFREYYYNRLKVASEAITQGDFALAPLSNIKVNEIKGILTAKLMIAQTHGIDVSFEADEEIDTISTDSVALVRMLGIILDNAIEAICDIGYGKLRVGCFKQGRTISFIVQNSCRSDIPALYQLKHPGFTSKGKGRGLGLGILSELVSSNPNITLETTVDDLFTQKISIEEAK